MRSAAPRPTWAKQRGRRGAEGGNVYRDVMLHLKGSGSFRGVDLKPNFTLNFDQVDEKQRFHGLEKFSLNNSVHDASFLCEALGRPMFLEAGVPVPRWRMPRCR
ncbi:MAG: CotH kinase family protein [Verrucomicrobia bacterium]|nr:CotH kinase family protein [Verrucomicrobiota bacterium]